MKIKIDPKNKNLIEKELQRVNGRAESFTICFFSEVSEVVKRAEKRIKEKIAKKNQNGIKVFYAPSGPLNAYKYKAKSTQITIERFSSGWFLTKIQESEVSPCQSELFTVRVNSNQSQEFLRKSGITVAE